MALGSAKRMVSAGVLLDFATAISIGVAFVAVGARFKRFGGAGDRFATSSERITIFPCWTRF